MNIKKSLRIIFRNKIYSLLNIAGLAIGITSAALIFLWVESKVNFNKTITNSSNIYIAGAHYVNADEEYRTVFVSSNPLAKTLESDFPEIKRMTRFMQSEKSFLPERSTNVFIENGAYVDSAFFDMIGVKLLSGDVSMVFDQLSPIVISESMARKLYGTDDPTGRVLINEGQTYEVGGIFKDMPRNTMFALDWVIPFRIREQELSRSMIIDNWGTTITDIYVELDSHTDLNALNNKLKTIAFEKGGPIFEKVYTFLYPINRLQLYGQFEDGVETGSGYIKTVFLFFLIGILILIIACINFMNLSTARSQKRALEVGVRKTFGTKKKHLVQQFLVESGLITAIALLISVGLIWLVLPLFNGLINSELSFDLSKPVILCGLLGIGLFCTFLAGSYPALYLSSFNPVTTLKMQKVTKKSAVVWIRQGLVVFQFTMAFILICTTVVIYMQIRLAQHRDLGIEKENLVTFSLTKELLASHSAVQNELLNSGVVVSSGFSNESILNMYFGMAPWSWNGRDPNDDTMVYVNWVSEGLLEAAGIQLVDGNDFQSSNQQGVIINETLARIMGNEGRVGGKIMRAPDQEREIIGIMKNYHFNDPFAKEPKAVLFYYLPERTKLLFVRLNTGVNTYEAIGRIQSILQSFAPNHAFEPMLMTSHFDNMFEEEHLVEKLSALFAILAIFISCLGLLGLSAFSAEQRTKEIGVRKVLGAKITDILLLLGKSYLVLLIISFVIGIPISLYATNYYLREYEYRISLGWDLFAAVALFITIVALLTVSVLSFKAAISNPIKSIKTE